MPELPEVETIKNGLQDFSNYQINQIFQSDKKLRFPSTLQLQKLQNLEILNFSRRARYLLINLSQNKTLIIHLGMSGKITANADFKKLKHDHFAISLTNSNNNIWLIFNDARRFGFIDLIESKDLETHKMLKNLGPEPLSHEFDFSYLKEKLKKKAMNIKTAMMDNKIVVGVGNIYINESLFDAKILPTRLANSLLEIEIKNLINSIKSIIKKAIELGGSSISDYVKASGDLGNFQNSFKVYGKNGEKCLLCKKNIQKIVQNGRSSFFCEACQK